MEQPFRLMFRMQKEKGCESTRPSWVKGSKMSKMATEWIYFENTQTTASRTVQLSTSSANSGNGAISQNNTTTIAQWFPYQKNSDILQFFGQHWHSWKWTHQNRSHLDMFFVCSGRGGIRVTGRGAHWTCSVKFQQGAEAHMGIYRGFRQDFLKSWGPGCCPTCAILTSVRIVLSLC